MDTKNIISIGRNHYGRIPMHELANQLHSKSALPKPGDEDKCKRCGTTENLLLNGYCINCDEELTELVK